MKSGTDPITIRAKLRAALPHAPEKQLVRTKKLKNLLLLLIRSIRRKCPCLKVIMFFMILNFRLQKHSPCGLKKISILIYVKKMFLFISLEISFFVQYDPAILHTSFARLLGPPRPSAMVLHSNYSLILVHSCVIPSSKVHDSSNFICNHWGMISLYISQTKIKSWKRKYLKVYFIHAYAGTFKVFRSTPVIS